MSTLKLTVMKDGRVLQQHEFSGGARVLVGRNEDCDVRIESNSVSRHHCEIVAEGEFHRLSDLGSSHGTFVNGRRVIDHSLNQGDVLTVGEFHLTYSGDLTAAPRGQKPEARRGGEMTVAIGPDSPLASGRAIAQPKAHLTLEEEGKQGRNLILQTTTFVIGRGERTDLPISGFFAPRVAALILRDRGTFRIWDTSPRGNAVRLNSTRVQEAELSNGDLISIADRKIRFYKGLPKLED